MIPSRKTCICLMLLMVFAVMTDRGDGGSTSAAPSAAPAVAYPRSTDSLPSSGVAGGSAISTNAPVATPARYTNGFFYQSENEDPLIEAALVVPGREMDIEATAQIIEDLSVMGRILEKNVLAGYGLRRTVSQDIFAGRYLRQEAGPRVLFPSIGQPKPLYVGGYGAVFFIQVDFPLLPPAEQAQEQPADPQKDPVWAETRRALFEPRAAQRSEDTPEPYSREKVDSFRRSLIGAMKHAMNIRALEPGEWLAIVVQGVGSPTETSRRGPSAGLTLPMVGTVSAGRSVMTLRARKADVDSYAKGEISQTQFEQRVQVMTY